jgi:hypothetical protein
MGQTNESQNPHSISYYLDHLLDMGRQLVKNQSRMMENGTASHLWDPKMVQRVLQNKEVGT